MILEFKAATNKAKKKNCSKGYPCGGACINRQRNCKKKLSGQANNFANWLKSQEKGSLKAGKSTRTKNALDKQPSNKIASYADKDKLKFLGAGEFGEVYFDKNGNPPSAIKYQFNQNFRDDELKIQKKAAELGVSPKFIGEGEKYTYRDEDGDRVETYSYAMEFISGRSLNPDNLDEVNLAISAVRKLHKNNIAHTDAHKENILVDPEGNIKILDFGLAYSGEIEVANEILYNSHYENLLNNSALGSSSSKQKSLLKKYPPDREISESDAKSILKEYYSVLDKELKVWGINE